MTEAELNAVKAAIAALTVARTCLVEAPEPLLIMGDGRDKRTFVWADEVLDRIDAAVAGLQGLST